MMTYGVGVLVVLLMLVGGGLSTEIGDWYRNLRKPRWNPPNWLFGPASTLILAAAGWSGTTAWVQAPPSAHLHLGLLFAAVVVLHLLWSPLFFKLKRPDFSLAEIPFLWLAILATVLAVAPISALSAWLLAPYLAWVTFATGLNLAIVRLNRPFSATANTH